MGIINVTLDSFSDGGDCFEISSAVAAAQTMIKEGANIIDIGGQSTSPGSVEVGEEEEIKRVVPVISSIRSALGQDVPISVDTFRASVARAAVAAGATVVNDISGGIRDPLMLGTVSELQVPMILMHSHGDSGSNVHYKRGVVREVSLKLSEMVHAARLAHIPRWLLILDPGIGFSKTVDENLELLRRVSEIAKCGGNLGYPVLVGPSRKRFVGAILGQPDPKKREWGNAAAVSACVAGQADIVRVHNVKEMRDVVLLSDGIWRPKVISKASVDTETVASKQEINEHTFAAELTSPNPSV
jgi:dihydropteroate synthase